MADSIALGLRLGTATEHANFAGIEGEITINETDHRAVVHDGVTKGGYPMAKKSEVDGAIQTANSASSTASAAQTAADEAKNTASSAVTTANGAVTTADAAKTSAESAVSTANTASTNASSAKTSAENAVSTANTAKSTADSALSVANAAVKKVNGQTPNASGEVTISSVTSATKATQDASGNTITTTYATKAEVTAVSTTASNAASAAENCIRISGSRGNLAGYESSGTATTINASARDSNQTGSNITVSNGSENTSWTKIVRVTAAVTVTLGSSWKWQGGSAPTIASGGILVCCWCGSGGIANFVSPS